MPNDERPSVTVSPRTLRTITDAITEQGTATRSDITHVTGLSRATVTAGVTELIADGLVEEVQGPVAAGRGRKPRRLSLRPPRGVLCAIDLGHGHGCVAIGDSSGAVLTTEWEAWDVDAAPREALARYLDIATRMVSAHAELGELLAIAVIVPQPVSAATGSIVPTPFINSWHGLEVRARVGSVFDVPIVVENDANAGALSEHDGTDSGLIFVKVSTGIGAGIIASGNLVRGQHGQAGEIGHLVVRPDGQLCGCGNRGCLETLASMPAVLRSLEPIHGRLDRVGLANLLLAGDVASARAMRDAGEAIGFALAPVVAALQVEKLAIGGLDGIPLDALVDGARSRIRALVHREVIGSLAVAASAGGAIAPLLGALQLAAAEASARVGGRS